jgi:uncharacterized membrane-anchored protein
MNRKSLILPGLVLALAVPTYGIVQKERLLASGDTVLLELAPVDPRSLMQGDYMRLDYAITRAVASNEGWPRDGAIVVTLDANGVATFVRRDDGSRLQPGEKRLRYRKRDRRVRVATDAFYFQEGSAPRYTRARYGELKVGPDGNSVLVGMRDSLAAPLR